MATQIRLTHWIVLAAAGGAAFYGSSRLATPDGADDVAEPVVRVESVRAESVRAEPVRSRVADASAPSKAAVTVGAAPTRAAIDVNRAADAFVSMFWTPPPAPPPAAPPPMPPAPPSAPSLPFKFVGMLEQKTDRPTAFLAKGEALHIVKVGDVVDSVYRVESLSPAQIVVTYLPLNERQSLSVAGGQK